jgi:hypothetical protein
MPFLHYILICYQVGEVFLTVVLRRYVMLTGKQLLAFQINGSAFIFRVSQSWPAEP